LLESGQLFVGTLRVAEGAGLPEGSVSPDGGVLPDGDVLPRWTAAGALPASEELAGSDLGNGAARCGERRSSGVAGDTLGAGPGLLLDEAVAGPALDCPLWS